MQRNILWVLLFLTYSIFGQEKDTLSLVFMGDIMGHDAQIESAFDPQTRSYNYNGVFSEVAPIIESADFALANLEVTLGGKPYKGYPQFSSPDALAVACKQSGIDVLTTANNHSCDRGKKGILRTLHVLDSLGIQHTGTFRDSTERARTNLLILEQYDIRVGLLNYTYGTNGLPTPAPTMVNRMDWKLMSADIDRAKQANLDKLMVMMHWGPEYQSYPSEQQIKVADFLFKKGVDIIIGGHPHVLQKMEYYPASESQKERFIAYSLGNFVSNQRTRKRDGGVILQLRLTKQDGEVQIADAGYYLTWVDRPVVDGKRKFRIIPCNLSESVALETIAPAAKNKMQLFMSDSRTLLESENIGVEEIKR